MLARVSCLTLLAVVAGCTNEDYDGSVSNRGTLCVRPVGATIDPFVCSALDFEADHVLALEVDFGICLSSSCDHDAKASCTATVEGSVVTVKAEGSYVHEGDECTDDCGFLVARCEVEALPAGEYEFVYAGETLALTLPSTTAKACTGDFGCCDVDADCAEGTCGDGRHCVVTD